ncbi:Na+/H+ antiporter subunit E [Natribacillus halophilus]|uniref:Multicomponent Na+:H+ antiporter subunit E n=1 Tax=Natribacillus halophilus TaxID=549003 RepID=A0A1G8JRG3_9BACI|nr:Na+/H+ antiporter subunit E [Natribacillus halophilus]SDI33140.1 multicomponent Na+:H+ antiporter subunit E [Natribacillus halophilus]
MAFQLFTNILVMFAWMLFFNSYTAQDAVIGYFIGAIVVKVLAHFMGGEFYLRRAAYLLKLIIVFFRELIRANLHVMSILSRVNMNIAPGFIAVPTQLESPTEKALFGAMMSLTPGTMAIEFADDNEYIYVHALNVEDKQAVINRIQTVFEKNILEVTRPHDI